MIPNLLHDWRRAESQKENKLVVGEEASEEVV